MAKSSKKPGSAHRDKPQQATPTAALDHKIARLKALRLARDGSLPPPPPRNASDRGKTVVLSSDALERYETLAEERNRRQQTYEGHLPPDRAR
jgi:hypothetical protein